jgi:uncharacterized protein (DUF1778 family)
MAVLKDRSLNIRVTEDEKTAVEQAASFSHMAMSQFMLQAALRAAEEVLADQTRFVVPADKWDEFVTLLDRPARVLPGLREAASKPSPFGEH